MKCNLPALVCAATIPLLITSIAAAASIVVTPQGKLIPKESGTGEVAWVVAVAEDILEMRR